MYSGCCQPSSVRRSRTNHDIIATLKLLICNLIDKSAIGRDMREFSETKAANVVFGVDLKCKYAWFEFYSVRCGPYGIKRWHRRFNCWFTISLVCALRRQSGEKEGERIIWSDKHICMLISEASTFALLLFAVSLKWFDNLIHPKMERRQKIELFRQLATDWVQWVCFFVHGDKARSVTF